MAILFSFHEGNLGQACVLDPTGVRWRGVIVNLPNTSVQNEALNLRGVGFRV